MVQECYSPERPARVLCFKRDGRTEVRLRRNIAEYESDGGVAFWRCEESAFTVPGAMSEDEAEARFDELWEEHEDDGKTAAEVARETKTLAEQAGTQTSVAAAARMYVNASVSLTNTELADVRDLIDDFKQGGDYEKGAIRRYDGKYWRMAQKIDSTTSPTSSDGLPDACEMPSSAPTRTPKAFSVVTTALERPGSMPHACPTVLTNTASAGRAMRPAHFSTW